MSYNITNIKIRDLHLELPLDFDFQRWVRNQPDRSERGYENTGKRWLLAEHEPVTIQSNLVAKTWTLDVLGKEIRGTIGDDRLFVTALSNWTDDGSGHLYSDVLVPLFKEFKGTLDALVVWEGGESIVDLKIVDGVVTEYNIE